MVDEKLAARRVAAMKRKGLRYIGGRGDVVLISEACQVALLHRDYVLGVVVDRGKVNDHGTRQRFSGPHGWNGEPVYWVRRNTWAREATA